jgi:hypothetical protein
VSYEDFTEEIIDKIYKQSNMPNIELIHPHKLALFLAVMMIGTQHSVEFATLGGLNLNAERYYVLTCAALSLAPIIAEGMCATVQALFLVNCHLYSNSREGNEESWLIIGIMARIALKVCRLFRFSDCCPSLTRSL